MSSGAMQAELPMAAGPAPEQLDLSGSEPLPEAPPRGLHYYISRTLVEFTLHRQRIAARWHELPVWKQRIHRAGRIAMSATGLVLIAQAVRFTGAIENGLELALGDVGHSDFPSTSDSAAITPIDGSSPQISPLGHESTALSPAAVHPADPDSPALELDNQPYSPYNSSLGDYERDPTHMLWKGTVWWHVDNYSRELGIRNQLSAQDMHTAVERALVDLNVGGNNATITERWEAARELRGGFEVQLDSSLFSGLVEHLPPGIHPGADSGVPPPATQPPGQVPPSPHTDTCAPFHPDSLSWPPHLPSRLECVPYEAETFMDANWWKAFALAGLLGVAYGGQRALDRSYAPLLPPPPDVIETEELAEDDDDSPRDHQRWWRRGWARSRP